MFSVKLESICIFYHLLATVGFLSEETAASKPTGFKLVIKKSVWYLLMLPLLFAYVDAVVLVLYV